MLLGWDQTSKSVKIYISLSGVESVPEENIKLNAKSDSFELFVMNLNKKNHHLNVKKLLEPIDASTSSVKVSSTIFSCLLSLKSTIYIMLIHTILHNNRPCKDVGSFVFII